MRLIGFLAALIVGWCWASPAAAVTFEFFEGNNCRQSMIGAYNYVHPAGALSRIDQGRNVTYAIRGKNDEARSVRVSTSLPTVTDVKGLNLQIYDHPDAKRNDDFVIIYILDPTQIPREGLCIPSFEANFDRNGVFMWRQPRNGLDGKVSALIAQCNACQPVYSRADLADRERRARNDEERRRQADEARANAVQAKAAAERMAGLRREMRALGDLRVDAKVLGSQNLGESRGTVASAAQTPMYNDAGVLILSIDRHQDKLLLRPKSTHVIRGRGLNRIREVRLRRFSTLSVARIISSTDTELRFEMRTALLNGKARQWHELANPFDLTIQFEYRAENGGVRMGGVVFKDSRFMGDTIKAPSPSDRMVPKKSLP